MLLEKQEIQATLYEFTGIKNIDIQRLSVKRAELLKCGINYLFTLKNQNLSIWFICITLRLILCGRLQYLNMKMSCNY